MMLYSLIPTLFLISLLIDRGAHNAFYALFSVIGIYLFSLNFNNYKEFYKKYRLPFVFLSIFLLFFFLLGFFHLGFTGKNFSFLLRRSRWLLSLYFLLPLTSIWYKYIVQNLNSLEKLAKTLVLFIAPLCLLITIDSIIRLKFGVSLFGLDDKNQLRASWTYNPIPFSQLMLFFTYLCLSIAVYIKRKPLYKHTYKFLALLFFLNIILSQTRASWISFLLSTPVLFFFIAPELIKRKKLLLTLCLLFLGIGTAFYNIPELKARIHSIKNTQKYSNKYRLEVWKSYSRLIKANIFTGVGYRKAWELETIKPYLADEYKATGRSKRGQKFFGSPHNEYLEILSGVGLLGFVPYILLWLWFWVKSVNLAMWFKKKDHTQHYLACSLLVSYLSFIYIAVFFDIIVSVSYSALMFCFGLVLLFDQIKESLIKKST